MKSGGHYLKGATTGVSQIAIERVRQRQLGFCAEHDDEHTSESLARAAACYALPTRTYKAQFDYRRAGVVAVPVGWPWEAQWWKPTPDDRIRELVKAGALIAAEIDRLLRIEES